MQVAYTYYICIFLFPGEHVQLASNRSGLLIKENNFKIETVLVY